ncbi:hypothetical protein F5B18DRAFT_648505 [Nemania serpens]|nr:hypothetical protein F5B18DRAFT_648505 [Nemania serpens]
MPVQASIRHNNQKALVSVFAPASFTKSKASTDRMSTKSRVTSIIGQLPLAEVSDHPTVEGSEKNACAHTTKDRPRNRRYAVHHVTQLLASVIYELKLGWRLNAIRLYREEKRYGNPACGFDVISGHGENLNLQVYHRASRCLLSGAALWPKANGGQDIWGIGHQLDTIEFDLDFSSMGLRHERGLWAGGRDLKRRKCTEHWMPFPFTLKIYDDVETKESEQITGNSIRLWERVVEAPKRPLSSPADRLVRALFQKSSRTPLGGVFIKHTPTPQPSDV